MLTVKNVTKSFGNNLIHDNISFKVEKGKSTVLWGPSGCGKTTLLNLISGIDKDFIGMIENSPEKISYCFQEDRLINHLSVEDNILFVRDEKSDELQEILETLHLDKIRNQTAKTLSGGQRQRVAIARAIYYDAPLVLLDEAFKSLDFNLKEKIIRDFNLIQAKKKFTVLIVTHDIYEAFLLGDVIYKLSTTPAKISDRFCLKSSKESRTVDDSGILKNLLSTEPKLC